MGSKTWKLCDREVRFFIGGCPEGGSTNGNVSLEDAPLPCILFGNMAIWTQLYNSLYHNFCPAPHMALLFRERWCPSCVCPSKERRRQRSQAFTIFHKGMIWIKKVEQVESVWMLNLNIIYIWAIGKPFCFRAQGYLWRNLSYELVSTGRPKPWSNIEPIFAVGQRAVWLVFESEHRII